MKFTIEPVHTRKDDKVDFHVEALEGNGHDFLRTASFYVQGVDTSGGWLSILQQIVEDAPDCCQDFAVTHARWEKEGTPHQRRMSEWIEHCPHHLGIGFPAYHVATKCRTHPPGEERMFECTYCGCVFPESRGIEVDRR
jgi:hypothetical protein